MGIQDAPVRDYQRKEGLIRKVKDRFSVVRIYQRDRNIIEFRHPVRVAKLSAEVGKIVGLKNLDEYKVAACLHDVGKCHEDVEPLMRITRGERYSEERRTIVTTSHTRLGPQVLELLEQFADFRELPYNPDLARELCLYHHPEIDIDRVKRPLEVKILSIVDKYDAMTSGEEDRKHKTPDTPESALVKIADLVDLGILDREITHVFVEECLKRELPKFN
jgi:HD-GYP domain-containing protein (c-di-GMP phosphodiesterase class II)